MPERHPLSGPLTEGMLRDVERLERELVEPEPQVLALLLLGLERERIVAVGYRDDVLAARLAATSLPHEVREPLARALRRVWKDEEMHARYLHGLLLRQRALGTRLRASLQSAAGTVGGWVTSVEQLGRWRDAPLAHAAAEAVKLAGSLSGRIPPEARDGLTYQTLHEYACFNVDAELSAVAGYDRILELLDRATVSGPAALVLPTGARCELEQARREELEHVDLFAELARAVAPAEDALAEGVDPSALAASFARWTNAGRRGSSAPPGVPAPAVVTVRQGSGDGDKRAVLRDAAAAAGLVRVIEERARETAMPVERLRVVVKADFMLGYSRSDTSTVVDPELVDELAVVLREAGVRDVAVVEARNLYDHFFANRSVDEVAAYFGYGSDSYRLVDLSLEQEPHDFVRGMALETVGRTWRDAHLRISFAKMKTDPAEHFNLTLKNLCNVTDQRGEFLFRDRHAELHATLMELLYEFPVHFGLLDAYSSAADGILGVIACKRPPRPLRIYAGAELWAVDAVASRHTGIADPRVSSAYREGTYWFDDWLRQVEVDGVDAPIPGWRTARHGWYERALGALARPVYEYASDRGSLFVPRMDPEAFPLLERRPLTDLARAVVRAIVRI
jgi:hypothetical protein